jgi:hypothetical protein
MKKLLALAMIGILVFVSAGKCDAQSHASNSLPPGALPTTSSGYAMSAKINGKDYKAHSMMPPDEAEQIVGFYSGDKYIGLPYQKKLFVAGKKISLDAFNADLTTNDAVQVWSGRKGEMEITKVNGNWVEAKFFFTGYSYDNKHTIEVTNGFFRIPMTK